jgi:hypothetical protein
LEGRKALIDPEAEIDRLYAAPLAEFVSRRKEIADSLRGAGFVAEAEEVAKRKKPSISAWVVNRLAQSNQLDLQRLLRAGEALEEAQTSLLAGKPSAFEEARKEEAAAVRLLQKAARDVVPTASAAILDRVVQTLRSATSAEHRALLKSGRLTDDLEPLGFEAFSHAAATAPASTRKKSSSQVKRADSLTQEKRSATEKATRLTSEALELERVAKEAEIGARKARKLAEAARFQADAAAEELGRISAELTAVKKQKQ